MAGMPKFENAPGLKVRASRTGTFVAYWLARADCVKQGYKMKYFPLWKGVDPTPEERLTVSEACESLQYEMLAWAAGGIDGASHFNGSVSSLIFCYTHDKDSPFKKLRFKSRKNYAEFMKRIEADHGDEFIANLKARDMLRWHAAWKERGVTMAHSLMRMFRGLLSFGMTILDDEHCTHLSTVLGKMRFEMGKPRTERLTAEMANAVRALAHQKGLHSIALAQAFQFEGMLRQKDVIGSWEPLTEPGPSFATYRDMKWHRGLLWSEIDDNLILRHVTSKRQKPIEIDLKLAPMVIEEFDRIRSELGALPKFGPVVVYESTGRPYSEEYFRQFWREIADECGIPKTVRNQDSRAGAISEATDAGVPLEHIRHAATHSDIATTQRYSRGSAEKTATVLTMRAAHRNKGGNQ